jgi:hypothetical protein
LRISHFSQNRQLSLVLGCLQASFHPFSPYIASAECKKGKGLPPQRPLLGLVTASVLLGRLEEFRAAILDKIRQSRFFLCLLTKRTPLASGNFASSVWLYQETGVAVAYGKKPLLLVEEGIDSEYVGELQRIYEHIPFTRSNHPDRFEAVSRRFLVGLETNKIPFPTRTAP